MNRPLAVHIAPIFHTLHDGTEILVRSISSVDKPLFIQGLRDLSPESIYYRFNTSSFKLNSSYLKYFTEVNHIDHVAIGAGLQSDCGTVAKGVGVGRYIVTRDKPHHAELALTVADAYQRLGVGTVLLAGLSCCARQQGIKFFVLHIHGARRGLIKSLLDMDARVIQRTANIMELLLPVPASGFFQAGLRKDGTVYPKALHKFVPVALA